MFESGNVKQFKTIEEMNQSQNNKEGDLAIVYGNIIKEGISYGDIRIKKLYFPENVELPNLVDKTYSWSVGNAFFGKVTFTLSPNEFVFEDSKGTTINYTSEDNINYTRTTEITNPVSIQSTLSVVTNESNWTELFGYFAFVKYITAFDGVYSYINNIWAIAENQLTAKPDNIYNASAYSVDGVIEGTLAQDVSNLFDDINAEIYSKISQQYENMSPITSGASSLRVIPIKLDGTPLYDTSDKTDGYSLFANNKYIQIIPSLDTSKMTRMSNMFYNCSSLVTVMHLDTSSTTAMGNMFDSCTKLVNVPIFDTSKVKLLSDTFVNCPSLSDDSLNNILQMCVNAIEFNGSKTLVALGLTEEQATKCTTLSNYEAFTSAGWTTGY